MEMYKKKRAWGFMFHIFVTVMALCWVVRVEAATPVFPTPPNYLFLNGVAIPSAGAQFSALLINAGFPPITLAQATQAVTLYGPHAAGAKAFDAYLMKIYYPPMSATDLASKQTTNLVMSKLALPVAMTSREKLDQDKAKASNRARLLDAQLRYEHVDLDDETLANIYGSSLGVAMDTGNFTYGAYVPYDYIKLKNTDYDMHRVGVILYGQYNLKLTDKLLSTFTLDVPYTRLEISGEGAKDMNVFGGGAGVNLTYDAGVVVPSVAVQYQYSDGDKGGDDYQHLFSSGCNVGFRIGEMMVINGFGIWNYDASSYLSDINRDRNYYDVGGEFKYSPTETYTLNLGYKKVLGLDRVDSDMVYLGALGHF